MKKTISAGAILAIISSVLAMILVARPVVAAQTKTLSARGIVVQLKERLRNLFGKLTPNASPTSVFCTQEAKRCPDGTYVGRIPPKCEFAACPGIAVISSPNPRKTEIATCKASFNAAKKAYAEAKEKARNDYLVAMRSARTTYQAAYKETNRQKSNDAKGAAQVVYQAAKTAAQNKYDTDKKAAQDAYQLARRNYNLCTERWPTMSPTASPVPTLTATPTPTP